MNLRRSEYPSVLQSPIVRLLGFLFLSIEGYAYEGNQYPVQKHEYHKAPPPPPHYQEEIRTYDAIAYRELNTSYHCGVIPDTNFELYRKSYDPYEVADVTPYGKFPWIVLILYKNRVVCQGTLVHAHLILTSSKCIPEYESLEDYEIRVGDWDVLTDYNEYESYADRELRVCSRYSISSKQSYSYNKGYNNYGYGSNYQSQSYYGNSYNDYSDLIIIKSDYEPSYDKFPQVKPLCLPKTYSYSYGGGRGYKSNSYNPYGTCWVAGWYGSEITSLNNHPQPQKVEEYSYGGQGYSPNYSYGGGGGYSQSYSYGGGGGYPSYYQKYYKGYDSSMIQKRAKVKQIPCPSYNNYYGGGGDYSSVCFIGVDGYDACVAERGAAIFCIVEEKQGYGNYDSGYNNDNKDYYHSGGNDLYNSYDDVQSYLHPEYSKKEYSYQYQKTIKANPSSPKPNRFRAVLYAVIQKPAKCRKGYDSYGNVYYRKSQPVIATKVDYNEVDGIVEALWTHGYDETCPVTKAKYKAPKNKSNRYNYYFGGYSQYPKQSYYNQNNNYYGNSYHQSSYY